MGKYVNIGNEGFRIIRNGNYVDKSGLVAFINGTLETNNRLTCVSRPRRFGKSFAAKMLCAYYDRGCDSSTLFDGLAISRCETYRQYLNNYNVIYLDMTLFISIAKDINKVLTDIENAVTSDIQSVFHGVQIGSSLVETLLNTVMLTGCKFIMIIDEWDALFREAKDNTVLLEQYIVFLRGLFKNNWTDTIFAGAYLTGILPMKKYGTQSAMSDFREYTMINPSPLEQFIGLTEPEVVSLCNQYQVDLDEMIRWYDGYVLGDYHIYNPNSVMEAIRRRRFENYWAQTETYEALRIYIELDEDGLKEAILHMLSGDCITVDTTMFQNDMTTIRSKDDVLTLLIHLGYLAYNSQDKTVRIPNEEIREEFVRVIKTGKHKELVRLIHNSDALLEATIGMDEELVASVIEEAHKTWATPLYYNNEQALRSVIKLAYISCMDQYWRIEELPSGYGYADIVYLPKKGSTKPALLIELKMGNSTEGALAQISERDYPSVLKEYTNNILLVGINYDRNTRKHTCKIEHRVNTVRRMNSF